MQCRYQLNKLKNINDCDNEKISYLKRIIVKGKAGTGKSTLYNSVLKMRLLVHVSWV